jgi:hypothetical protein
MFKESGKMLYTDQEVLDELMSIYRVLRKDPDEGMKLMRDRMFGYLKRSEDS